jgi:hypothetical protein
MLEKSTNLTVQKLTCFIRALTVLIKVNKNNFKHSFIIFFLEILEIFIQFK